MASRTYCFLATVLFKLITVTKAEICYYGSYYTYFTSHYYCSTGCCGYYYNRLCCDNTNTGQIVGYVFGAMLLVGFLGVVIFLCLIKKNRSRGAIVHPNNTNTVTVATVNQVQPPPYGQPAYAQPQPYGHSYPYGQAAHPPQNALPPPPAYSAPSHPPPAY
ncbi:cysteine and tyrosine-rich protein 1-like [Mizuhopecten yessoensis]|uniref:Cysteine and tyrosine-rich protein 1 n=1 Tax=Mizuhopecten yessoensis TaxID=6573 RepID=A0A210QLE8_MIZYE|nr:cysteine and tyrosine-rich protein 1-like [Mizuhopecten yessoensis]OWF49546.1 hypothetical protein KP79_PYT17470 [Mizuhopecten yessoensis]